MLDFRELAINSLSKRRRSSISAPTCDAEACEANRAANGESGLACSSSHQSPDSINGHVVFAIG